MGQLPSTDHIPETVENVQGEICRQARMITEIATLTYDEFQKLISDLNTMSKHCTDPSGKVLVFAVKKGTDSTVLWKGTVRIACVKVDRESRKVESYRLLNLSEFLKVFNTLHCQFIAAQDSCTHESANQESVLKHSFSSDSDDQKSLKHLTATMLFEEVDQLASPPGERLNECCICLERTPDVMLPCAHSYCLPCIEQWNVNNKTCPICRETLDSTDDTWVISEAPESQEISQAICNSLMDLASPSHSRH